PNPKSILLSNMTQLQIKATISDIESKTDKNAQPYYRISLAGLPNRYFYAFSYNLPAATQQLLTTPHHLVNRLVLLTYQELPNQGQQGTFFKVQQIELST
ncbi:2324_t:CDS:1, partial [Entrophospora sp. SA101]